MRSPAGKALVRTTRGGRPTLTDSDFDDDWGPVPEATPTDQATDHPNRQSPLDRAVLLLEVEKSRVLGTVATWRGLRRINGDGD